MLKAAIRDENPVVFLEHELMYGESFPVRDEVLSPDYVYEIGKAKIEREGTDVTLGLLLARRGSLSGGGEGAGEGGRQRGGDQPALDPPPWTARLSSTASRRPTISSLWRRAGRSLASAPRSPRCAWRVGLGERGDV